jgi:hypothetical protein
MFLDKIFSVDSLFSPVKMHSIITFISDILMETFWQSVTLGDEEATRRGGQKTVLERKGPSTFNCGAEIVSKTEVRVHRSLEATVDAILAGRFCLF